jgi:hypothetical protein
MKSIMKNLLSYIILLTMALTFHSCEDVIEVDLNDATPELLIEANVSDTTGPYTVRVSMTVGFNQVNNFQGVDGAFITLSDNNGLTDTLTQVSNGIYTTHNLRGSINSSYSMFAIVNEKQYSSLSQMPSKTNLDSLYTTTNGGGGFGNSNKIKVVPKYRDPVGVNNFYRFILYINGVQTDDVFVQSDKNRDGQVFNQPLVSRTTINPGDFISIDMQCIDENVYKYFNSLARNFRRGLNQSQTPVNPPSNITGGKLGYFNAHTVQRKSIIAH